jgi:hypothetical protein
VQVTGKAGNAVIDSLDKTEYTIGTGRCGSHRSDPESTSTGE